MVSKSLANWSDRVDTQVSEGNQAEAETLLLSVIKDAESRGEESLGLAAALNDLGLLYCKQGLTLKADPLLQRALAIRHKVEETPVPRPNHDVAKRLEILSVTEDNSRVASNGAEPHSSEEGDAADWETRDWEEDLSTPPPASRNDRKSLVEDNDFGGMSTSQPPKSSGSKPRGRGAVRFGGGSLYSDRGESEGPDNWGERETRSASKADEAEIWLRSESAGGASDSVRYPDESDLPVPGGSGRADTSEDWAADRPPLASTSGMDHVIEVYGFAPSVKTMDLETLFWGYREEGVTIKWVDDTHAVAVFRRPSAARAALDSINDSKFKLRPFAEASLSALRLPAEELQPPLPRPKTTARAARRLIASALDDKNVKKAVRAMSNPSDERRLEAERKSKRSLTHQLRADAWGDGY
ncbi:hypothetical protein KFL_004110040 [Klebsormidium nitens]|uniref:RRM domain-containing protein n=1 Tax=Klebsormidium nitens TaxID=105231 RepID=A0A1Y1IB86_KLENI|nr:hypothetical protein KFL_004110040 [Klebsormidium nitens]|eukprot:GAQ88225.1 hypothetical protein KFL_004110040 [Klebsormidium nitens]